LRVILYQQVNEITAHEVTLTTETGEKRTIPTTWSLCWWSDADLTLLKSLGVEVTSGKLTRDAGLRSGNVRNHVRGVYVAGHFTNARHIKAAIDVTAQDCAADREEVSGPPPVRRRVSVYQSFSIEEDRGETL